MKGRTWRRKSEGKFIPIREFSKATVASSPTEETVSPGDRKEPSEQGSPEKAVVLQRPGPPRPGFSPTQGGPVFKLTGPAGESRSVRQEDLELRLCKKKKHRCPWGLGRGGGHEDGFSRKPRRFWRQPVWKALEGRRDPDRPWSQPCQAEAGGHGDAEACASLKTCVS